MSTDYASATVTGVPRTETLVAPAVEVQVDRTPQRDPVRWGPIVAGVVTAFAVLLLLTTIGIALGLSSLGGNDNPRTWGTAAGIWGGLTLLVAFFLGGWLAARAAAPAVDHDGVLNGFVTGAATMLLLLWLATTALTGALGFFAGTITDVAGAAAPAAIEATQSGDVTVPQQAENVAANAGEEVEAALPDNPEQVAAAATEVARDRVAPGAWGTAIVMILAVGAAAVGGMVGQNQRRAVVGRTVIATR